VSIHRLHHDPGLPVNHVDCGRPQHPLPRSCHSCYVGESEEGLLFLFKVMPEGAVSKSPEITSVNFLALF